MEKLISNFPQQLEEALSIGRKISVENSSIQNINNVLIVGLGGSGIGGTIINNYLNPKIKVPLVVTKNYYIPEFVNEHTLVIMSSYSGNTEETIQSFYDAQSKNAILCAVSSGGKLVDLVQDGNYPVSIIPSGMPPRSCIGYNFIQVLFFLNKYNLIDDSFDNDIQDAIKLLNNNQNSIKEEAKELAKNIYNKLPIIYSEANYEGVAVRWRQQINENSKMLCWHHTIPEMNHNELVGWTSYNDNLAVIILRNSDDYERSKYRIEINKKIIGQFTPSIYEVFSQGESYLERALYLINLGDWLSFYIGELKGIDVSEVKVIDYLKSELAKK